MSTSMTLAAFAALVVTLTVVVMLARRRSDERLQWSATRQRDWTVDELDSLAIADGDLAEAAA